MNRPSFLMNLVLFYGNWLPYHPGKGRIVQWLRSTLNLDCDQDFEIVREGIRWRLNPSDFVQRDVFWIGRKDYYDVCHLQRLLKPGDVFLDVGANFGYYSVVLAMRLGKQIEVHAFEPNPPTLARFRHHVEINGLEKVIHLHDFALSDQPGTAALGTKQGNTGCTHIVPLDGAATPIRLTTLDAFCEEQRLTRLDVIKIDVEGFEDRVLMGGKETFRRWQPTLLLELEPPRLREKQTTVQRVAELVRELGYEMYYSHRNSLRPLVELPDGDDDHMNTFCLPRDARRATT